MSNTFLARINQIDPQLHAARADRNVCVAFVEAGARRLIHVDGYHAAAIVLQQLADDCASAHVLPLDHWKAIGAYRSPPAKTWRTLLLRRLPSPVWAAWIVGLLVGVWLGASS